MAITVRVMEHNRFGDYQEHICSVDLDNSYATGGYAVTAAAAGFNDNVTDLKFREYAHIGGGGTATVALRWDPANAKLKAFGADGAAAGIATLKEIANATDLSAQTGLICSFLGRKPA